MRLLIAILMLASTLSAQTYIVRPPPSTVRNGGFETDPDGDGKHWPWYLFSPENYLHPSNLNRSFDTTAAYSGSHAMGFYRGECGAMVGVEPLTPRKYYSVEFLAKKFTSADTVILRVAVGDQGDVGSGEEYGVGDDTTATSEGVFRMYGAYPMSGYKLARCTSEWQRFYYPIVPASDYVSPVGAFQFIIRDNSSGVLIDNVTVYEVFPHKFYVAAAGHDSSTGVTVTMPMKTVAGVSAHLSNGTIASGDTVLFKSGETFDLSSLSGSGLVLGTYGGSAVGRVFYVSATGSDAADGLTESTPWKSLNKISLSTFSAGDNILLKRGDTFQGEISKTGAGFVGTADSGIVIGAYGTGAKPILYGDFTGAVWTQVTGYSGVTGVWKTYAGYSIGSDGWEKVNGTWQSLTRNAGEIRFYLNNQDSVKAYLQSFTASSFGPGAETASATDTMWIKTHDGNSPADSIHIFRSNQINGQYVTVRDIEFRNWKTAVNTYPAHYSTFRNLTIRNTRYISLFLANKSSYNLVDSCTVDSAGYDAFYSYGGRRNIFRYDTVRTVNRLVLGTSNAVELAGIGFQEDTACVVERSAFYDCEFDGLAGFYNDQDTVRYCTFTGQSGIWMHGSRWVAHNNTVTTTGATYPAITATLSGTGETKAYSNTLTSAGDGQAFQLRVGADGTLVYTGNTVILTGASNARFDDFQYTTGIASTNNAFYGTAKFNAGLWPNEVVYNSLAEFQAATIYEDGSTWNATYTPPSEPITTTRRKLLIRRTH